MRRSIYAFVLFAAIGVTRSAGQHVECSAAAIKQVDSSSIVGGQFNNVGEVSRNAADMVEVNLACKPVGEFKKSILYYKKDKSKGSHRAKFQIKLLSYSKCELVKQARERGGFTFPLANSSTVSAFQEVVAIAPAPSYFVNAWRDLEEHLSGRACKFVIKKMK